MQESSEGLEARLARAEERIELLYRLVRGMADAALGHNPGDSGGEHNDDDNGRASGWRPAMPVMTTKQHVVLQMLTRGASNDEIAKRMGVTINTAKVHVRSVARKLGERKRAAIGVRASEWLSGLEPEEYSRLSGGLPINWDAEYRHPDPYASLYKAERGE